MCVCVQLSVNVWGGEGPHACVSIRVRVVKIVTAEHGSDEDCSGQVDCLETIEGRKTLTDCCSTSSVFWVSDRGASLMGSNDV